jgi:hypothetical protein
MRRRTQLQLIPIEDANTQAGAHPILRLPIDVSPTRQKLLPLKRRQKTEDASTYDNLSLEAATTLGNPKHPRGVFTFKRASIPHLPVSPSPGLKANVSRGSFRYLHCQSLCRSFVPYCLSPMPLRRKQPFPPKSEEPALREYFGKKKELHKKYEGMLALLKTEEASATQLAIAKCEDRAQLTRVLEEVREYHNSTANLLREQALAEEEELLNNYKQHMKS